MKPRSGRRSVVGDRGAASRGIQTMTVKANVRIMATCCGCAAFGVIVGMLMDERISLPT